jgi:hypothetical protein
MPLVQLLASQQLDQKKNDELKALREQLDPFVLSEVIERKLEHIWDLAHYRYKPAHEKKKANAEREELSLVEREILEAIFQAFQIIVYVRRR